MQPHPRICSICHQPIPAGDTYACGISLAGWPHQVPQTLYCCRSTCKPAALAEAAANADQAEDRRQPTPVHQVASPSPVVVARANPGMARATPSTSGDVGQHRQQQRRQLASPVLPLLQGIEAA